MLYFKVLLSAAALTLLAASVESSSSGGQRSHTYDLSGQALTDLYNSPVQTAEWVKRPFGNFPFIVGDISHSGVRVTLGDGAQWLVHKGNGFGLSSQTVVTDARHMSSGWKTFKIKEFGGTKTVSDFVAAGGPKYNLFNDNCHDGAGEMMNQ